ncbi:MAG: SDR family oxidoreductase [Actinobacteria bacterium]|nr:SDR family oxidoreductase [Actinomycetota bacterium]
MATDGPMQLGREHFTGNTVLVTGAARNIGRAIALAFAANGLDVAVHARNSVDDARTVVQEVEALGVRSVLVQGELGDFATCERIVSEVESALGPIDYLISNAARRPYQWFLDITPADWDAIIAGNLSALFYLSRLVIPKMLDKGFGRIIAIGGPDGVEGSPHRAHNVTCKAALPGLIKSISTEFAERGVLANVLAPGGGVDTSRDPVDFPAGVIGRATVRRHISRAGNVEELGDACLYLASDYASYITGQTIHVDGGMVMR